MMTIKEVNEKVNKASWETPACELEQLKVDILKKCNDLGLFIGVVKNENL